MYGDSLHNLINTTNLKIFNSTSPTCYRAAGGSFIDKFLSNSNLIPMGNIIAIPNFSDHLAISCKLPLNIPDVGPYHIKMRLFNKAPVEKINRSIGLNLERLWLPTNTNLTNGNCEQLAEKIDNISQGAVVKYVPTAENKYRYLLSPTVRSLQRESKKIQRKNFKLGPLIPGSILVPLINKFKLLRIMILNGVKSDTGIFFTNIYNSIDNKKSALRIIKQYTGHKKRPSAPAALFTDTNKTNARKH